LGGSLIPRIAGPLEGPNQLSGFLGIGLAVIAAQALARRRPPAALESAALFLGSAALLLTLSRAGLVTTLIAFALVVAVSPGSPRGRLTFALAVAGGAALGIGLLAARGGLGLLLHFSSLAEASDPGSVGTRSQLWHAALVLWQSHPLFGIGAGNFELELARAGYPSLHTHANSLYLQALAEGGPLLLAATLGLAFVSIARFARGPFSEPFVVAAFAASVGFALHQSVDFLVFFPKIGDLWWIVLALGAVRAGGRAPGHA
jgi:O-antigen ligase